MQPAVLARFGTVAAEPWHYGHSAQAESRFPAFGGQETVQTANGWIHFLQFQQCIQQQGGNKAGFAAANGQQAAVEASYGQYGHIMARRTLYSTLTSN